MLQCRSQILPGETFALEMHVRRPSPLDRIAKCDDERNGSKARADTSGSVGTVKQGWRNFDDDLVAAWIVMREMLAVPLVAATRVSIKIECFFYSSRQTDILTREKVLINPTGACFHRTNDQSSG